MADATNDKQTESEAPRGAGIRSENSYPFFNLETALRVAVAVRQTGGTEATDAEVMQALGLSSRIARSWTYRVSSAKEFGLIVRAGRSEDARLRVTDLARRILMPENDADARAAKISSFMTPKLYGQLAARYKGAPVPQPDGLKNVLVRDYGMIESVGLQAAQAFLDSAQFVGLVEGGHLIIRGAAAATATSGKTEDGASSQDPPPVTPAVALGVLPPPKGQTIVVPGDFILHQFQLRKEMKLVVPLPPDLTPADVKRLHKWMETLPLEEEPAISAAGPK
jgi:hypothetical protein